MKIIESTIVVLFLALTLPIAFAATATKTVTIYVNVSVSAEITVTPTVCSWVQVPPGGAEQLPCTLTIKNTGSVNLSSVYASVNSFSLEASNPLGTGDVSKYSSGSFLTLRNSTGDSGYRLVNRMDWNDTTKPTGMTSTAGAVSWGFFRNHTRTYLWELIPGTDNTCRNQTNAAFNIKTVADTGSNRDMSSDTATETFGANTTEWATWTFSDGPLQNYCAAVYYDCRKLMIYQWDLNTTLPTCTASQKVYETTDVNRFNPDEEFSVNVTVWVPKGVPSGDTTNSTLTITANY